MAMRRVANLLRTVPASHPTVRGGGRIWTPCILGLTLAGGVAYLSTQDGITIPDRLKNKFLLHADSAQSLLLASPKDKSFREDPETSTPFPLSLTLLTQTPPLTLIGLGVRKVSFLRVKVYSAGFYLEEGILDGLEGVQGWKSYSAQRLLTPSTSQPDDQPAQLSGEALMRTLLDQPIACAVRIVPVRNTDFGHLRDGFTRALIARQKIARTNGELTEADETRIAGSLQTLKGLFPSQSVPKGQSMVLLRTSTCSLVVEFEGKVLGEVKDRWMAREMMLAYFADKDVISPKLKEDVAAGLQRLQS